jgi:hypothetical protein
VNAGFSFRKNSGSSVIIAWRRLGATVAAEPGETTERDQQKWEPVLRAIAL